MNIIIIGCGRVGAELAYRLYNKGHKVVVVDQSERAFQNLAADFRGRTVVGHALDHQTMHQAGFDEAQALAAVTNSDSINAIVSYLATSEYNIPKVVVRNYDSRWRTMHEVFGSQVVCSSSWGAQRIEELLYDQDLRTVFSAGNGEVALYEFSIPAQWDGQPLADLLPEKQCVIAALTRTGRALLPDCDFILNAGDVILISATLEGREALDVRLEHSAANRAGGEVV